MIYDEDRGLIYVVDDDLDVRQSIETLLRATGYTVQSFAGAEEFLARDAAECPACLILDIRLGDDNGLDLQQAISESDRSLPVILLSGHPDVPTTVRGMRAGALTLLTKPFEEEEILKVVEEAINVDRIRRCTDRVHSDLRGRFSALTRRETEIFGLVTAGLMNKQIAGRLELSEITVKIHRRNMMRKMAADSLVDLVRMADVLGIRYEVSRYNRT
ncbi:response regulator transcription factor [Rhizobium pusense]|nr:response regulator transcription factor [Agrobacterium pusense]